MVYQAIGSGLDGVGFDFFFFVLLFKLLLTFVSFRNEFRVKSRYTGKMI